MRQQRAILSLAAAWGAAEATLFFFVPDVLLSRVALTQRRVALLACAWATAGAVAGGILVWFCGLSDPEAARELFESIPGISRGMIQDVQAQLGELGVLAIFVGPAIGTPYKVYALEAAGQDIGLLAFALVSVPARIARFAAVAYLASLAGSQLRKIWSLRVVYAMHIVLWILFYAWYFQAMSQRY